MIEIKSHTHLIAIVKASFRSIAPWRLLIISVFITGAAAALLFHFAAPFAKAQESALSPHLDPVNGVNRILDSLAPVGSCNQCHEMHALEMGDSPYPNALFTENSNSLCFTATGVGPCHQAKPTNYPATEETRIPEGFPDAGYFEYNSGGTRIPGVQFRNRWPGAVIYNNPGMASGLHYFSPHRNDTDMPIMDPLNNGSCLNCHNPHGSENPFDMLVDEYRGTGGFADPTTPSNYALCFKCHSTFGPGSMEEGSRLIADYYDSAINGDNYAGHQIRMNSDIAISWPSHVRAGDKLSCSDCHNPHGSQGYNNEGPNAFLLSDERPGWSNLTDTLNNPDQNRRFCLGCHIPADGVPGSQTVAGIVMNTLPDEDEHLSTNTESCGNCHGASYSSSTSYNVHHPRGHGD